MKKKLNFKNLFTGLKWQGGLFAAVSILAAIAIVIVVPIACAYPFFQKYFISGLTIGAVKG